MGASESKLAFKEHIFRLAGEPDVPLADPFWSSFYQLPESAEDVFSLWSANDLHTLLHTPPNRNQSERLHPQSNHEVIPAPNKNVESLIYSCVARLQTLQTERCFPDPQTPIAPEVLNCLRILTRLLPYIYEDERLDKWEDMFFWQPRRPHSTFDFSSHRAGPLLDGLKPTKVFQSHEQEKEIGRPLGELLMDLLVDYLFFPGFTLAKEADADGKPSLNITYKIWQSGIGCKQSNVMTKDNERNAVEVMRLLLTLCSRTLYISPGMLAKQDIKSLSYVTTQCSRQVVLSMICSLLNTICRYNPASWRVPIDISSVAKDPKQQLVSHALQLLLVLVTYTAPNDSGTNVFRKALGRLHRAEDFQFIQQGLNTVLTQPVSGMPSYLPGKGAVPWAPETLQLFWELLQCNKRFRSFIIDTDRAHDFFILVLFYAMDAKDDPARQGLLRMCIFIIQTLSVEASFGRRLNKKFVGQDTLPLVMRIQNFHGSYADYLITTIHALITTTKGRLEPLYPALLAIISNIAPHTQDMQRATSSRLMDLFVSFSATSFLLSNEMNHNLLASILETMNALLEHQYQANRRFVDVVVRSQRRFTALRDFTVEGAVDEVNRYNKERKDRKGASRGSSLESFRSTNSIHPALSHVPEEGLFAVGVDDDDDDDDDDDPDLHSASPTREVREQSQSDTAPQTDVATDIHDAVPVQSRNMSDKARGKQPVSNASLSNNTSLSNPFSRTASANTLSTQTTDNRKQSLGAVYRNGHFEVTAEWVSTWLPHLPLHAILLTIDFENERAAAYQRQRALKKVEAGSSRPSEASSLGERPGSSGERSNDLAPQNSTDMEIGSGSGLLPAEPEFQSPYIKVQCFSWSPLSIGWYRSMLWSWIYANDVATSTQNGIWIGTKIRLFNVVTAKETRISLRNPRGAVDAAGNAIAERLGSLSVRTASREV